MKRFLNACMVVLASTIVLMWSFFATSTPPSHAESSQPRVPTLRKEKIAVMPFLKGRYGSDINASLKCPVCELSFLQDELTPDCDRTLTRYAQEALEMQHEERVVPFAQVEMAYAQMPKDSDNDTPVTLAQGLGKRLNAHYVLLGTVWRYKERQGGARGVQSPASVAFAVFLISVAEGKLLWEETFTETQRSLSENVLEARTFFERGAKWLTADELARFGMDKILKDFPY